MNAWMIPIFHQKKYTIEVDDSVELEWPSLPVSVNPVNPANQVKETVYTKKWRPSSRFSIEHATLPLCIHCGEETTLRCPAGCRMPLCSDQCRYNGAKYHTNYCIKPNF